jgi:hypothetical protein
MSAIPPVSDNSPAPDAASPAPARKNFFARHKVLTVLGAVVILIVVIGIASGAQSKSSTPDAAKSSATSGASGTPSASASPAAKKDTLPGLKTPVVKGKLEFTVLSVESVGTRVGSDILNTTAQGQFIVLTVRVKNVSDSPQTFLINNVQLKDAQGRSYDADSTATIYAAPNAQTWIANINPGNTVEGPIVFDIPTGAAPTTLVAKDSLFSGGVAIALR